MAKVTKQQRAIVYLNAAKYYSKLQGLPYNTIFYKEGFCSYIKRTQKIEDFEEYYLFINSNNPCWFWFDRKDANLKIDNLDRITALLFAYQMCK